jgi:hypothetical protein
VDGNLRMSKYLLMGRAILSFKNHEEYEQDVDRFWYVLGESCE